MQGASKTFRTPLQASRKRHGFEGCGPALNRLWAVGHGLCKRFAGVVLSLFGGSECSGSKTIAIFPPTAHDLAPSGLFKQGWAPARAGFRKTKRVSAFSLIEALIALGLLGIFMVAGLSAIVTNQVCDRKAKEEAIAIDFLTKYVENIKALPFTSVAPGLPINSIYNGAGGAPLITIPANSSPVSLNTTAFQTFYPDLLWLTNLSPTMQVTLTQNALTGTLHDIEINVQVNWEAPLAKGGQLQVQVDFYRTVDVPTL
jgi:Tfp pilus assembly protein PilV